MKKKRNGILICGYFGCGNLGDDAILKGLLTKLKKKRRAYPISVMFGKAKNKECFRNIRKINRFSPISVIKEMKKRKFFIFGGGSLLQSKTSLRSLLYYVALIKTASLLGMKIKVTANGIGPLNGFFARRAAKAALSLADSISVRDKASFKAVKKLGIKKNVVIIRDPALSLSLPCKDKTALILQKYGICRDYAVLSLRPSKGFPKILYKKAVLFCRKLSETNKIQTIVISMNDKEDISVCSMASKSIPDSKMLSGLTVTEAMAVISSAKLVIGMRLHSLIFAKIAGVPFIALPYDIKVKAFAEEAGKMSYFAEKGINYSKML